MAALCKCVYGHEWHSRLLADEPDVNYTEVEDSECPECGTQEFSVIDVDDDTNDRDWDDSDWHDQE